MVHDVKWILFDWGPDGYFDTDNPIGALKNVDIKMLHDILTTPIQKL